MSVLLYQGILPVIGLYQSGSMFVRPSVVCQDGFKISIQASEVHYCYPQSRNGPYTHVELGHPNQPMPPEFDQYDQGEGIYARVPVHLVKKLTDRHGGIVRFYTNQR